MAFYHVYNVSGGRPLILDWLSKDTETLNIGDFANAESGEADLGATNDTDFIGQIVGAGSPDNFVTVAGATFGDITAVDSTTTLKVIANPDAVYTDRTTTTRLAGATLDISGATGAQVFAATSNVDFTIVVSSRTGEDTLAKVAPGEHYLDP